MILREKMLAIISELNDLIAEREDSIECTAIGMLTKKNVLKFGPPGQAKSFEIDEFLKRITDSEPFVYLMTKQTDEEQIFARLDVGSLIPGNVSKSVLENDATYIYLLDRLETAKAKCVANPDDMDTWRVLEDTTQQIATLKKALAELHSNEPRMITTRKIPEKHFVFLDEIFKAHEGILNALLMALNERRYINEGFTTKIPTISFFAASNEIPDFRNAEDQILRALFDRFDLKIRTDYIKNPDTLLRVMLQKQDVEGEDAKTTITLEELEAMQKAVTTVTIPKQITELMRDIRLELHNDGIIVTDRKIINFYPIAKAKSWLSKRDTVVASDLKFLKYYLWTMEDEIPKIEQVLDKYCNSPLQQSLKDIVSNAEDSYEDFKANVGNSPIKAINKFQGEMVTLYRKVIALETDTTDTEGRFAITNAIDELELISRGAHEECGADYAPLPRLNKLI